MAPNIRIDNISDGRRSSIFGMNEPEIAIALPDADNYLVDPHADANDAFCQPRRFHQSPRCP